MFKNLIRRWFNDWQDEPRPARLTAIGNVYQAATVAPISNGYIVQWAPDYETKYGAAPIITFCRDAEEIANAIVAHNVGSKLGVQRPITPNPAYEDASAAIRKMSK
jgi:hypothetical protein